MQTFDSRITALVLHDNSGPILLVSMYMPTDCDNDEPYDSYACTCAKIATLYEDRVATRAVVVGDQPGLDSLVYSRRLHLVSKDLNRLVDTFTYCSEANSSWLDHILCSSDMDDMVSQCSVFYSYVSSDHKPLIVSFDDIQLSCGRVLDSNYGQRDASNSNNVPDWSHADDCSISRVISLS